MENLGPWALRYARTPLLYDVLMTVCSGLIVSSAILPLSIPISYAYGSLSSLSKCDDSCTKVSPDRPAQLGFVILISISASCLTLGRYLSRITATRSGRRYSAIPLEETGTTHVALDDPKGQEDAKYPTNQRKLRLALVVLVVLSCLRVELFRRVRWNIECAGVSYEVAPCSNLLGPLC